MASLTLPNTVHTILKSALKAARPEDRTDPPWHLGAFVRPVCPARGQISMTITLTERSLGTASSAEQRQVNQLLALVRKYLAGKAKPEALRAVTMPKTASTSALGMAYNAVGASLCLARGKADLVSSATQAAAAKAVKLCQVGAPVRSLLASIDQEILCLECEAAFDERAVGRRVERVLWRGADETARKNLHWVARLEGGVFAGSFKLVHGKGPMWVEGALDDVIASVPERSFVEAVAMVKRDATTPCVRL